MITINKPLHKILIFADFLFRFGGFRQLPNCFQVSRKSVFVHVNFTILLFLITIVDHNFLPAVLTLLFSILLFILPTFFTGDTIQLQRKYVFTIKLN